jgi:FlaA1/EpsC-like NDP-sugar epimerase
VAFSNGSLPAGFLERIAKGQPLSAPYDVRRYFVSPTESGELCLLACLLGQPADIFFPQLDEPRMLTFSTIGDALLRELGYGPDRCDSENEARLKAANRDGNSWPVYYFASETSGEKSFEEFYTATESVDLERFEALGVVAGVTGNDVAGIHETIADLRALFAQADLDKEAIVEVLARLVPTFSHVETGKSLDQKM